MSYNQQYLVAAQMGHQQVQVQHQAEIAHQQVIMTLNFQSAMYQVFQNFRPKFYVLKFSGVPVFCLA